MIEPILNDLASHTREMATAADSVWISIRAYAQDHSTSALLVVAAAICVGLLARISLLLSTALLAALTLALLAEQSEAQRVVTAGLCFALLASLGIGILLYRGQLRRARHEMERMIAEQSTLQARLDRESMWREAAKQNEPSGNGAPAPAPARAGSPAPSD